MDLSRDEILKLYSGLYQRIDQSNALLTKLLLVMQGRLMSGGSSAPIGASALVTGKLVCKEANIAQQMPMMNLFPGCSIAVSPLYSNTGSIYVSGDKSSAEQTSVAFHLLKMDTMRVSITQMKNIWVMSTVANEGVNWAVEV